MYSAHKQGAPESKQSEQQMTALRVQRDVLLALGAAPDIPSSLHQMLAALTDFAGVAGGCVFRAPPPGAAAPVLAACVGLPAALTDCLTAAPDVALLHGALAGQPAATLEDVAPSPALRAALDAAGLGGLFVLPLAGAEAVLVVGAASQAGLPEPTRAALAELAPLAGQVLAQRHAAAVAASQQAEQALIESEARYRTLVETSPGAILLTDLEGQIQFCNQQAAHLFGYDTADDLRGRNGADLLVSGPLAPGSLAHVRQGAESGDLRNIEYTMRRRDGTRFPAEVSSAVVANQHGVPDALIVIVRDISERKQAEDALTDAYDHLAELNEHLSHSHNLLQAVFDGLDDGLLLLDHTGTVQASNRALAALFGSTPEKLVGQSWAALYPRLAPDTPGAPGAQIALQQRRRYQHTRYQNLEGSTRILDVQTIPLPLQAAGQGGGQVIVHVTDVTEHVQLHERVIANERFAASGRLAASVAHEINTPLQSIQTALGLIGVADAERRATYLAHALEETQRVARIVRQLLDLYRPGGTTGPVHLNTLTERLLLLIGKRLRDQRVAVETALDADLPDVHGRADELMQLLLNLLVNAIDAMPEGGTLQICTCAISDPPDHVSIAITDTGGGISPHMQQRIFEPFVTTREHGNGLGLSICAQIVERHGGSISVSSRLDVGSTFTVVLPRSAPPRAANESEAS
jgi:PAS domain S-box-containing protein